MKCPFSYFLRYGLSLKEPFQPGFPDAYAGTLFHYILESLTNAYGKEYSEQSSKQLRKIVDKELAHLTQIFPSMELALMNVKERLLISMTQTLEVLQEFETHSQFSPTASELEFHYDLLLQENVTIALHGFIDRLDTYQDLIRNRYLCGLTATTINLCDGRSSATTKGNHGCLLYFLKE